MIPYKVDVPMHRWPLANFGLIAVTCMISVYMMAAGPDNPTLDYYLLQPDNFKFSQLIGSAMIHADPVHLIGNMIFLWVFGNAVNAKIGHLSYLGLYFGTAVFTGVMWCLFGPTVMILGIPARAALLGASGAIMGVIGAFLVLYPKNDVSIGYFWVFFWRMGTFDISAYWVVGAYMVLNLWGLKNQSSGVGYLAHVTGIFFGFAATAIAVYLGFFAPEPTEENLLQTWGIRPRDAQMTPVAVSLVRYLVEARDPASGFRTQLKVSAKSELDARNNAIREGLAVDRVTRIP